MLECLMYADMHVFLWMCVCVCVIEKDKNPYTRQRSAPQFRSRGSKLGLSLFTNYIFPGVRCYGN